MRKDIYSGSMNAAIRLISHRGLALTGNLAAVMNRFQAQGVLFPVFLAEASTESQ
ncbi:hypothetical protein [Desulfosarcina sp.]|jgi:hypothetical protein|uniref:hypothetical protein n=1 Tax=Desulfosarcina sp. TaxID=2027861 RepID=UPI0029B52A1A|nr:hypothetical protein [Desulfosarcina sp.]MDX2453120.1 hypothetical protein [Desulfosarcina sp.]MDX2490849.1 hypothetical protein [Desulfosarcina sp.]